MTNLGWAAAGLAAALIGCGGPSEAALFGAESRGAGGEGASDAGSGGGPAAAADATPPASGGRFEARSGGTGGAPAAGGTKTAAGGLMGSGGAAAGMPGSGGADTGGIPSAGGADSAGGSGSGGVATGGAPGTGGTPGAGGVPVCDPSVQCAEKRCFGLVRCSNGGTIDCSKVTHCGSAEYCKKTPSSGTCTSFFDGLGCNGSGSGPIHICAYQSASVATCDDCQVAPSAPGCALTSQTDYWECKAL